MSREVLVAPSAIQMNGKILNNEMMDRMMYLSEDDKPDNNFE